MGDAAIEALRTVVQVADNEALVQARNDLVDAQNKIAALERKVVSRFRKEAFQYAHVVLQEANAMLPQAGVLYQHTISHKIEVNGAQEADLFVSPPSQGTDPQESYITIEENGSLQYYHIYSLAQLSDFASKHPEHFNLFMEKVTSCDFNYVRDTPSDGYANV